jgi:tetratricopeptide (TPR) repeat protein
MVFFVALAFASASAGGPLEAARDAQDMAALQKLAAEQTSVAASKATDASAQYQAALAQSYVAEVALELRDRNLARNAAESGIRLAEKAVQISGGAAEYHRVLGTLCGQVIPANVLAGLRYGKCARDEIQKAIDLDPKAALAYVSRGVGNYYLPPTFGGGIEPAIADFRQAIQRDPKLAEAHLWLGLALRKAGRNAEARDALSKAAALNPNRVWIRQQLEKTPAK